MTTNMESFNGRLRDECLNQHWFLSLDHARRIVNEWRAGIITRTSHTVHSETFLRMNSQNVIRRKWLN
ncbi:MAG: transposase [Deltaproteobacteria bacterium]|nr:transposase [Deltaproteobacteria bacterium]